MSNNDLQIALGDTVKVKLKKKGNDKKNKINTGTVSFFGSVDAHKGTWYGISFEDSIGFNDGSYKQRKYFECKAKHGVFVQSTQIIKILSKSKNKYNIRLHFDAAISLPDYGQGAIKFAGLVAFNAGTWYGIELQSAELQPPSKITRSDGTVSGIKYFDSKSGNVLFRREDDLFAQLAGIQMKNDIVVQRNLKPSMGSRQTQSNPKHTKYDKITKVPRFTKSESAPFSGSPRDAHGEKGIALMDLSNGMGANTTSKDSDEYMEEIKDNDQSNETKEDEEYDFYQPKLSMMDASDEIDADIDEDVAAVLNYHDEPTKPRSISTPESLHQKKNKKKQNMQLPTHKMMLLSSQTSDLGDDNMVQIVAAYQEEKAKKEEAVTATTGDLTVNVSATIPSSPTSLQLTLSQTSSKSTPPCASITDLAHHDPPHSEHTHHDNTARDIDGHRARGRRRQRPHTTKESARAKSMSAENSPYNVHAAKSSSKSMKSLFEIATELHGQDSEQSQLHADDVASAYIQALHEAKHNAVSKSKVKKQHKPNRVKTKQLRRKFISACSPTSASRAPQRSRRRPANSRKRSSSHALIRASNDDEDDEQSSQHFKIYVTHKSTAGNTSTHRGKRKKKKAIKFHQLSPHAQPVPIGGLSLDYNENEDGDSSPADNDILSPRSLLLSKSAPTKNRRPAPIETSHSATSSPIAQHDRPLTFPTMSLNTDNAIKISAATPDNHTFKVVVLGQSRSGKTSIIRRLIKDKFMSHYKMTLGAVQQDFKCEVPIDLLEEVSEDKNLMRTMTSFLRQVNEENGTNLAEKMRITPTSAASGSGPSPMLDHDPFEDDDNNAEFGGHDFDFGDSTNVEYKLPNMEKVETISAGLFDFQSGGTVREHGPSKSITDYGQWTAPEIDTTAQDVRKVSMKLQITLDIIDMGFHPTNTEILDDVNAIILVMDFTKKESMQNAVDKYQNFVRSSAFASTKNRRRSRTRSGSGTSNRPTDIQPDREYIPIIIAINKSDAKKKHFKKKDVKKIINKKLQPIINEHFPPDDEEKTSAMQSVNDESPKPLTLSPTDSDPAKKRAAVNKRIANATLLQPPNLSFVYDEHDEDENEHRGSDSEAEDAESDMEGGDEHNSNTRRRRIKTKKSSSDLLTVASAYHQQQQLRPQDSDPFDPFNTPQPAERKSNKKKKSGSGKVTKLDKNDIRYIDIIACSAKNGKNIEKLFSTCIKKTLPSKLTKSVAHKRTKTTAHVTAPIWLRQVVAEFQTDLPNLLEEDGFFGNEEVDDNFMFLGDNDDDSD